MATNIFLGEPPAKIKEFIIAHYGPSEPDWTKVPLTFTASGPVTIALNKRGTPNNINLEYSLNEFKTDPIPYTIGAGIDLTDGQKMSMRAVDTNTTLGSSISKYYYFSMTGEGTVAASGNIMSLLNKNFENVVEIPASYCFYRLFQNCVSLTTAPALPATTLADRCYYRMFEGCTSLTTAPELKAETLASQCYYNMFSGCTSLTTAPELKAEALGEGCYECMFYDCTSLTTAPTLPAKTLVEYCYADMFSGCTSLTTAPEIKAETLADYCCYCMFSGCTSLSSVPAFPSATTLASECYTFMLYNTKSPLTISNKTFDEVADLIQNQSLIGGNNPSGTETEPQPREIICSDKTMIATPEYVYYEDIGYIITGWTLKQK